MRNEASVSGIFAELISLVGDAWREVALYTGVIGGLTAVAILVGLADPASTTLDFGLAIDANDSPASALTDIVIAIVSFVANYVLLKRCLALKGRLRDDGNRFWPYLGMALLSAIAMVFGLILLIVPGIILLVRWSAASGYVIGAGQGVTDALTSSWNATKGHGWAIFFAGLVLFFGVIVAAGMIGAVAGLISMTIVDPVAAFVEAATGAVFSVFGIAIYCLVEDDADQLGEVFA